jgi:hypothetical protein
LYSEAKDEAEAEVRAQPNGSGMTTEINTIDKKEREKRAQEGRMRRRMKMQKAKQGTDGMRLSPEREREREEEGRRERAKEEEEKKAEPNARRMKYDRSVVVATCTDGVAMLQLLGPNRTGDRGQECRVQSANSSETCEKSEHESDERDRHSKMEAPRDERRLQLSCHE